MKGSVSTWSYSDQGKANHEAIFGKDKPKTGGKRRYVVRDGEVVEDLPEEIQPIPYDEHCADMGKFFEWARVGVELYPTFPWLKITGGRNG